MADPDGLVDDTENAANERRKLLVVDDEPLNIEIICEYLDGLSIDIETAADGLAAWSILDAAPGSFDAVLLDRMMPGMSGIEVLERIRADDRTRHLPVILQTAAAGREQVLEGLRSGAYYYLTKPFERDMLLSVVRGALEQSARRQELLVEIVSSRAAMEGLQEASFGFRTPAQARAIAALLAKAAPVPEMAVIGLNELMLNAIEHGNLEISYDEKSTLLQAGRWDQEIVVRLADAGRGARTARVRVTRTGGEVVFDIEDEGAGFDWSKYLEVSAERAFDSHGRGISMARSLSFSTIQYLGAGNRVRAVIG